MKEVDQFFSLWFLFSFPCVNCSACVGNCSISKMFLLFMGHNGMCKVVTVHWSYDMQEVVQSFSVFLFHFHKEVVHHKEELFNRYHVKTSHVLFLCLFIFGVSGSNTQYLQEYAFKFTIFCDDYYVITRGYLSLNLA